MNHTKADRLTTLVLTVFKLNGQFLEWGNQFAQPHALTSARWQVLGAIALAPQAPSIPQIAETMGVTRQGVLKQINLLVDEGLVAALANPTHKRSPLYALTPKGKSAYEALEASWRAHVQAVAASFSGADLDVALRVLTAMSEIHATEPRA